LQREWKKNPKAIYQARPALVFAVLGQARADHRITPEEESGLLKRVLMEWAGKS